MEILSSQCRANRKGGSKKSPVKSSTCQLPNADFPLRGVGLWSIAGKTANSLRVEPIRNSEVTHKEKIKRKMEKLD